MVLKHILEVAVRTTICVIYNQLLSTLNVKSTWDIDMCKTYANIYWQGFYFFRTECFIKDKPSISIPDISSFLNIWGKSESRKICNYCKKIMCFYFMFRNISHLILCAVWREKSSKSD